MYKRISIVENGSKRTTHDDAHYITFTDKGCYESDKKGFAIRGLLIKYVKDENNLHCYYGYSSLGESFYYFSADYTRLNVKVDDVVHVYIRETQFPTTASLREMAPSSGGSGGVVVTPSMPNVTIENGGSHNHNHSGSSSVYVTCKWCKGSGICERCKGRCGEWKIQINTPDIWVNCPTCSGKGRCWACYGTGKR